MKSKPDAESNYRKSKPFEDSKNFGNCWCANPWGPGVSDKCTNVIYPGCLVIEILAET